MNKDWKGNLKSVYIILGASSHFNEKREKNDYYATDPKAVKYLLDLEQFNKNILEPACGQGHISEVLKINNYNVTSSDLIDRKYGEIKNFFDYEYFDGDIITNPPYKIALEFIIHSLNIIPNKNKIAMFLKLQFLEGKRRKEFFKNNPPKFVYVSSSRILCCKNGDFNSFKNSAIAYSWFVWEKGYKGDTIIRWFN